MPYIRLCLTSFSFGFAISSYALANSQTPNYIIQKGETLAMVANRYGFTADQLKTINRLQSTIVSVGQKIYIPNSPAPKTDIYSNPNYKIIGFTYYEVKVIKLEKSNSLQNIAKEFNTDIDSIRKFNGIFSDFVSANSTIGVPVLYSSPIGSVPQITPPNTTSTNLQSYTVKRGDTLGLIAKTYNVSTEDLTQANQLNNIHTLSIGQVLLIPRSR